MNHFYVAVDQEPLKLGTLVELLEVLARNVRGLPLAIFCSTRDTLDYVLASLVGLPAVSTLFLHSDQSEEERACVLESFQSAVLRWEQGASQAQDAAEAQPQRHRLHVLVTTDACAPPLHQAAGEHALAARLLINFDIPHKKELYARRIASCFGYATAAAFSKAVTAALQAPGSTGSAAGAAVPSSWKPTSIFCVSAVEAGALRTLEESMGQTIKEMPIDICEMLLGS